MVPDNFRVAGGRLAFVPAKRSRRRLLINGFLKFCPASSNARRELPFPVPELRFAVRELRFPAQELRFLMRILEMPVREKQIPVPLAGFLHSNSQMLSRKTHFPYSLLDCRGENANSRAAF